MQLKPSDGLAHAMREGTAPHLVIILMVMKLKRIAGAARTPSDLWAFLRRACPSLVCAAEI